MTPAEEASKFVSVISTLDETADAVEQVLADVRRQLGEGPVDLVILFVSFHHVTGFNLITQRLHEALAPRVALGTTAVGVIGCGQEHESKPCISILAGRLPGAQLRTFAYADIENSIAADDSKQLRSNLIGTESLTDHPFNSILMFADPFSTPMVRLIPAINRALPGIPIIGGMASGAMNAGENRLMLNQQVHRDGLAGVAIGGSLKLDTTVSQGCRPIGHSWIITKSRHNIIQEVGQRPVMEAIQSTAENIDAGDRALLRHGMFVGRVINEYKDRFGRGDFLIRNIIGADQKSGFIAVNDLVRVGQTVQFHVRDKRTAEEDLRLLLEGQKLHGPPLAVLLCTCNGRGTGMYDQPNIESTVIREELGDAPMAGFFAAGEIGPIGQENFLHNLTATLAVFRTTA